MKKKSLTSISGLVLAVLLVIFLNIVADIGLQGARLDLTENQLYTLTREDFADKGGSLRRTVLRGFGPE